MNTQNVNTAASESTETRGKGRKTGVYGLAFIGCRLHQRYLMAKDAADYDVACGEEAHTHDGLAFARTDALYYWLRGFFQGASQVMTVP